MDAKQPGFNIVALPLTALLVLPVAWVIHTVFVSPLAKIPNAHPLAAFTPLWILYIRLTCRENRTLYEAHQKLGPVVRIGPNEISTNSPESLRTIYGGNFDKTDWYSNIFTNYSIENMVGMKKAGPHRQRRRLFSNIYSKSYLQGSKEMALISKTVVFDRLLPVLKQAAGQDTSVDVMDINAAVGTDFTCAYLFGLENGSNFIQDSKVRKQWLDSYQGTKTYFTAIAEGYVVPLVILNKIGIKMMPNSVLQTIDNMGKWNLEMCGKARASRNSEKLQPSNRPVVQEQMEQGMEKIEAKSLKHPKEMIIASEMFDHILAGHDSTAATLTYLMYELSNHPKLQSRLRREIQSLDTPLTYPSGSQDLPSARSIDALPLLDAVFQETLRRYPAAAGSLARVTPEGTTTIEGYSGIQGGVRISASCYTLHRNAEVFPEPESWKPKRWLEAEKEQLAEMKNWFFSFGGGPRMCLGNNFATQGGSLVTQATESMRISRADTRLRNQVGHGCHLRQLRDECRRC